MESHTAQAPTSEISSNVVSWASACAARDEARELVRSQSQSNGLEGTRYDQKSEKVRADDAHQQPSLRRAVVDSRL